MKSQAVAYLRVSTEEQSLGPEAQRAQITAWAGRQGVEIVSWHEDHISGSSKAHERPGLTEALESLQGSGAGILVAAKRDRIARDVVISATITKLVSDLGATIATADGVSAEATPEGALMRTLLDAFAQYELEAIRFRTRAALKAKKARGERTGSVPYGYKSEGGKLVPDQREQAGINRAHMLREEGFSLRATATILTDEGFSRTETFHLTTLTRILSGRP